MKQIGLTVFGCEKDEADVFYELAPRFGIVPTITSLPVSTCEIMLTKGNQCISVSHKSKISQSCLLALRNAGVKYISTRSIGSDHIDIKAAKKAGITIGIANYAPDGVADYTLMLMLMALRNAKHMVTKFEKCDFRLDFIRGKELRELNVGVMGAGHIGKAVIERLQGFGCHVLINNGFDNMGCISLQELLERSDILTLHIPLNKKTHHLIGGNELKLMKQGAILVNTGRGGLVDTGALIEALKTGKLGGAALDVLEGEEGLFYNDCSQQQLNNPYLLQLQKMSNVIISPHMAYYTSQALYETVENTILNCLDFERSQNHG